MNDRRPLATLTPRPLARTSFTGEASVVGELLRAPASGISCAHWRLHIVEFLAPGMELVHEVVSPQYLEISCQPDPTAAPTRVRLSPESARLQAVPTLFREGSAGARAVAEQFGLRPSIRVEEVVIRHGEVVQAQGVLSDPAAALSRGPFRTIDAPLELLAATLRVGNGLSLRPIFLPWALGTAAALLGTIGVATALFHWFDGKIIKRSGVPSMPMEIGARKVARPLWP